MPPLMDVAAYQQQVARDDGEIQAMTAGIAGLEREIAAATAAGRDVASLEARLGQLRRRRRDRSHQSLAAIYGLYRFPSGISLPPVQKLVATVIFAPAKM